MRMFRQGGNAFDAGAAAVLAASVTEIQLFGFGGEAPVVLYDAKGKRVVVVNGQGLSARGGQPGGLGGQALRRLPRAPRRDRPGRPRFHVDRARDNSAPRDSPR